MQWTAWIWLGLVGLAPLVLWQALRWRGQRRLAHMHQWEPTTTRPLNGAQRKAYALLVEALPQHMVLAQLPLARFLKVDGPQLSYQAWFLRVGHRSVDFLVCDRQGEVVAVVELERAAQRTQPASAGARRKAATLESADVPVLVWQAQNLPGVERVRQQFHQLEFGLDKRWRVPTPASDVAPLEFTMSSGHRVLDLDWQTSAPALAASRPRDAWGVNAV